MSLTELQFNLNSFYILAFGLLTFLMLSGLILYSTGHVRTKNTTSLLTQCLLGSVTVILAYIFFGHGIIYGSHQSINTIISSIESFFQVPKAPSPQGIQLGYSLRAAIFFQMLLPAICICFIALATAERIKVWAFIVFALFFATFIYPIEGYWLWGDGFLYRLGFIDYAGAGLVYLSAAAAGFSGILIVGPRRGKFTHSGHPKAMPPANTPLMISGLLLLFLGSLGFNAGVHTVNASLNSILSLSTIFLNSTTSASAGLMTAMIITRVFYGTNDLTFAANGLLAGLAASAADPLHASLVVAFVTGVIAAILAVVGSNIIEKFRLDDPAGIISTCGLGSIWGLIACALIQEPAVLTPHSGAGGGLAYQMLIQFTGIFIIVAWVFISSGLLWQLIQFVMGLRIPADDELRGLDIIDCGTTAYPEFTKSAE